MLGLLARYADSWNTNWLGMPPGPYPERLAVLEEACKAEGRDPATVTKTVGLAIVAPGSDGSSNRPGQNDQPIRGTTEEVAAALQEYAKLGVNHAILSLDRPDAASVAWLGEVIHAFQAAS